MTLDYLTWTTFVDIFPQICLLLGFMVFFAGGLYVGSRVLVSLLNRLSDIGATACRYTCWKFPKLVLRKPTKRITVVNVGEDEFVVYLDGRFVGTEAVSVPVALLKELGIGYIERRVCMRWFKANECKMPDYLEEITLLNED